MQVLASRITKIVVLAGLIFTLGLNNIQVLANSDAPVDITVISGGASIFGNNATQSIPSNSGRTQSVQLNPQAIDNIAQTMFMDQGALTTARFQVFSNLSLDVQFDEVADTIQSGYILQGTINNNPNSAIVLSSTDGVVNATLELDGKQYHLQNNGEGGYYFEEIDQSVFPESLDPIMDEAALANYDPFATFAAPDFSAHPILDVMVVYTSAARSASGSQANIQNLINLAVAETNIGYERSGINGRMRLVHTAEINYDETILTNANGWGTALGHLTNQDGVIDEVRSLRDEVGADIVVMMVENMTYCGIGWLMTPSYTMDTLGNSLVSRRCATGYYSFGHEIGHNLGAHHDAASAAGGTGMYAYSYGYQDPAASFRTIMAYNCAAGCPRINHWSNPNISYNGKPTGTATADNARTLNNTFPIAANFRNTMVAPNAPSNLAIQSISGGVVSVNFVDNSYDETGFKVEKSLNGSDWSLFATLPANTTSFSDTTPACDTQFYYRVQSFNDNSASAFSNIASTGASTCSAPSFTEGVHAIPSTNSITLNWKVEGSNLKYIVNVHNTNDVVMASLDEGMEVTQLPVTLNGLEKDTSYTITITASNEFGSVTSDPITVQTASNMVFLPLLIKN